MLSRDEYLDRWSALHGGYDPRAVRSARWWLGVTYRVSRPVARAGVAPDVLTLLSLAVGAGVVALAALEGRWPLAAAGLVVLSGLLDNVDGCVAVLTGRTTRVGFVLDSVVDRLTDALYVAALWVLGAPGLLCVAAGGVTWLQEYARARAGNAGMAEIGVATVWERPTRVIITALTLVAAGVADADLVATIGAATSLGLAVVGSAQLGVALRRSLSS